VTNTVTTTITPSTTILVAAGATGSFIFPSTGTGHTFAFQFSVTGASVSYSVLDPNNNIILIGNGGSYGMSGSGSFTTSTTGSYSLSFKSSGLVTPSVVTISFTTN